jgi:chromosome segregation ATPase
MEEGHYEERLMTEQNRSRRLNEENGQLRAQLALLVSPEIGRLREKIQEWERRYRESEDSLRDVLDQRDVLRQQIDRLRCHSCGKAQAEWERAADLEVGRLRAELQEANEALDADWDIRIDEEKAKNERLRAENTWLNYELGVADYPGKAALVAEAERLRADNEWMRQVLRDALDNMSDPSVGVELAAEILVDALGEGR